MLQLTRTQRAKLIAGECPGIVGKGRCPVERGYEHRVLKNLTLRVLRVDARPGGWKLHYEVTNSADPIRLLRRTPPVVPPSGDGGMLEESQEKRAARESSYTSSPVSAIEDAGEAVDEQTQDRYSREGTQERVRRIADYEKRKRERPLHEQLQDALDEAARVGVDTTRYVDGIEKRLEALRRRTEREAA